MEASTFDIDKWKKGPTTTTTTTKCYRPSDSESERHRCRSCDSNCILHKAIELSGTVRVCNPSSEILSIILQWSTKPKSFKFIFIDFSYCKLHDVTANIVAYPLQGVAQITLADAHKQSWPIGCANYVELILCACAFSTRQIGNIKKI